eukprot:63872_1
MGNETSARNSITNKVESENNYENEKKSEKKKLNENIDEQQKIEINNEDNKMLQIVNNIKQWNLNDSIYIYSNLMNEYMPGIIVEIDNETNTFTIRYWDIQCLEIKHKKRKLLLLDCNEVKIREYNTAQDPWNMPFSEGRLSNDNIKIIKKELFKYNNECIDIDIDEWFIKFKIFLKDKKILRIKNPFIRLISSYLTENNA